MKKINLFCLFLAVSVFAANLVAANEAGSTEPPKYALVIGNGSYDNLTRLSNPVNDANDITAVLEYLGFTVEKLLNGNMNQMEDAVMRLKDRLGNSKDSYGFFFYAGHGVQSGGENFLIPVDANIPGENYLRNRAVSVQTILDELNDASNFLNVVVLDACRDNPFGWSRSGSRGLSIVGRQPADSIIVYATSAGQTASDGQGRNGLFTSQLLSNLVTPGLEVTEVFRRTGANVAQASNNQQIPAIYSQFFGTAYLAGLPVDISGNMIITGPVIIGGKQTREPVPEKFWSVGASLGSTFIAPWLVFTAHGTLAPFRYSFFEIGFDVGIISGAKDAGYFSLYPYVQYSFYWPFVKQKMGVYTGLGGGWYFVSYKFDNAGKYTGNYFLATFTAGMKFLDMIDVSYTLRTNFRGITHKISAGYTYRFNR